ncbi:MAG: PKD domain-containing protein, partial [Candidatus Uhrbacteria bacterium]|nr:PKD domain-containing protein [Candidatus Uhrbacteria bacterium]
MPNDKLKIQLLDPQGSIIDQAGNGLTPFAGSNDENKASMTRMSPLLSGDQPGAWFTATSSQNFDIGIFTYGTPGWCDGCQDKTTQNLVTSTSPTESVATTTQSEPTMTQSSPTSTATSTSVIEAQESSTTMPIVIDYGPQHPVASFSVAGEFQVSSTLLFDAASSTDPNGDILNFVWDFGDGITATTTRVTHTYTTSSSFVVSLTASDGTFFDTATTSLMIIPQPIAPPPPPSPIVLRLNEIFSAPDGGSEWIELSALSVTTTLDLQGFQLEDAKGVIFRFASSTWNASSSYLQVMLNGSHLNNDGDIVRLRDTYGRVIDESAYSDLKKNQSWIRSPDETGDWHLSEMPSPGQPNIWVPPLSNLERRVPKEDASPVPRRITIIKQVTQKITQKTNILPSEPIPSQDIQEKTIIDQTSDLDDPTEQEMTEQEKKAVPIKPRNTKTKPSKAKKSSTPLPRSTTIPMLPHLTSETRVKLMGTVASLPKLLSRNQFVIQTKDGRGLLIQGNGKSPSPP